MDTTRIARPSARPRLFLAGIALALFLIPSTGRAQSLVAGSLRGQVRDSTGGGIIDPVLTITNRTAGYSYTLRGDRRGRFSVALVVPGTYDVVAEQVGFQPVRRHGVVVRPGEETWVDFVLLRRPPPINTVTEIPEPARSPLSNGRWVGQELEGPALEAQDARQNVTDLSHDLSGVVEPQDGRLGYALAAGGLPQNYSRFFVDGLDEAFLRHPGAPGEPAAAPLFPRNALMNVLALDNGFDLEWEGAAGSLLSAQTRVGSSRLTFRPYLTLASSGLGGETEHNPGDSSATSFQAGAVLSGALVRDTAQFLIGFNFESLELPTPYPWERDSTTFNGSPVSLRDTLAGIAADSFGANPTPFIAPTVRSYRGGNVFGRLDWRLGAQSALFARFGFARFKEQNPQLDQSLVSGAGSRLESRDLSGAIGVTTSWSRAANEVRVGLHLAKRDWISSNVPTTWLVAEGAAIGNSPLVPALFDQRGFDINETFQASLGRHRVKVGGGLTFSKWKQTYAYGRQGIFRFGDLDAFGNGLGDFFVLEGPASVDLSTTDLELFLQDTWSINESFLLQGGIRYDKQKLPGDEISLNTDWLNATGIGYETSPSDGNNLAPRFGFVWDVQNRAEWVVRGGGGLYFSRTDLALFSEAALFDGAVTARRGQGSFGAWPALPDETAAPVVGPRLTLFDDEYQNPKTAKWDLALSHAFPGRITMELAGTYHHTDYLPRRVDLNRPAAALGQTSEGRPTYGSLVKQGGMISAAPNSNRQFTGFDLVSGIVSSGFSDYYAVTATIERRSERGLGFRAAYTYSRTNDNWLLGPSGDPTDQLSPFPEEAAGSGEWADGRSDLDIPHRVSILADYTFPGRSGFSIGVRYRYRSGLPFTPGFRPGVDMNGDGSGNNDPAFLDASLPGATELFDQHECLSNQAGGFAERNSCREDGVHALDLRVSLGIPMKMMGGGLRLVVDAFNLVSSDAGIVDRAVYLVDPTQPLATGPGGAVVVPLLANPDFGKLLARRGLPRIVRFGLKVDY